MDSNGNIRRRSWKSTTTPRGAPSLADDKVHNDPPPKMPPNSLTKVHNGPSPKMPPNSLTVVVLASFTAIHPSTKLLSELILSLRLLSLPARTPVILSHQGSEQAGTKAIDKVQRMMYLEDKMRPRALLERMRNCRQNSAKYPPCKKMLYPQAYHDHLARVERASRQGAVPAMWQEYLQRVRALLPIYRNCTGLEFINLIRPTGEGGYRGNIMFAMRHVQTPFVLKIEQDREFRNPEPPRSLPSSHAET